MRSPTPTGALAEHEAQLQGAVTQQKLLMQEIHHRVKNNLQIVASLLNLQASRIRLPEAEGRVPGGAATGCAPSPTLHRHLYADGELGPINMRSFLMELAGQLFQAMGEREGERIALDGGRAGTADVERPGGAAVADRHRGSQQAIKYAFPGGPSRSYCSPPVADDDTTPHLVIEDDGIGIPAGRGESREQGRARASASS